MLHAVVMAGGSGTRFWPQSRRDRPKQLLPLAGPETMLQATVGRIAPLVDGERTLIVTSRRLSEETQRQLPTIPPGNILQEPCGRNTAPCVGWAALELLRRDANATMLVIPADHVIRPEAAFLDAVQKAAEFVEHEPSQLVLFGVTPTYPATGYGYMERGEPLSAAAYRVARFREKPERATAQAFVDSGNYYWNCGIFVWKAAAIVEQLDRFEPEMMQRLESIVNAAANEVPELVDREFPQVKSISIDFAVLEKAQDVSVLPATFDWDDVGSWRSLERLLTRDPDGNTVDGPFVSVESTGCIVRTTPNHLVTALGVEDLIIVHTPDATLVANKNDENSIRKLVDLIAERGYERFL